MRNEWFFFFFKFENFDAENQIKTHPPAEICQQKRREHNLFGKIIPQTHNILFKPTETPRQEYKKNTKKRPCARAIYHPYTFSSTQ